MNVPISTFSDYRFEELAGEWLVAQKDIEHQQHITAERVASEWSEAIGPMSTEYAGVVASGGWQRGPEDLFNIIGIGRREVRHSAMIAWLLDPLARHGLGPKLLQAIVRTCFPDNEIDMAGSTTVDTEVVRGNTRADIVAWGQRHAIVIEVKIDAGEGDRQCDRLFDHFSDEPGSQFLFLTPTGRSPKTATGDARDAFQPLSFSKLRELLVTVEGETNPNASAVGRATVKNYISTLEKEFR